MIRNIYNEYEHIGYCQIVFPSGEPHIKIDEITASQNITIIADIINFNDLGYVELAVDAIRRMKSNITICLHIPFFPCARQDRVANKGEALSVAVFANRINNLDLNHVTIYDPHSDVTPALLNNVRVFNILDWIGPVIYDCNPDVLISPDAGAAKKVNKIGEKFGLPVVQCGKIRDTKTGQLRGFQCYGDVKNKSCLYIDDIFEGSYGLFKTSEILKEKMAAKIDAYATHGCLSKGLNENFEHVNKVWITNTIQPNKINRSGIYIDKLNVLDII